MSEEERRQRAVEVWQEACAHQARGELEEAIRLHQESIALCPTPEAHTFLGWTYSRQGRLAEAIAECRKAIALDPEFGNPYNDIGVYLMQQGDPDAAVPWLEQAKQAPRYEPRQFPYINLGRIYLQKGQWMAALKELEGGARVAPKDPEVRKILHELRGRLN